MRGLEGRLLKRKGDYMVRGGNRSGNNNKDELVLWVGGKWETQYFNAISDAVILFMVNTVHISQMINIRCVVLLGAIGGNFQKIGKFWCNRADVLLYTTKG